MLTQPTFSGLLGHRNSNPWSRSWPHSPGATLTWWPSADWKPWIRP